MIFYSVGNPATRLRFLPVPFHQNDDFRKDGFPLTRHFQRGANLGRKKGRGLSPAQELLAVLRVAFTFSPSHETPRR